MLEWARNLKKIDDKLISPLGTFFGEFGFSKSMMFSQPSLKYLKKLLFHILRWILHGLSKSFLVKKPTNFVF